MPLSGSRVEVTFRRLRTFAEWTFCLTGLLSSTTRGALRRPERRLSGVRDHVSACWFAESIFVATSLIKVRWGGRYHAARLLGAALCSSESLFSHDWGVDAWGQIFGFQNVNSPSRLIPSLRHFWSRQYWHLFLLTLSTTHCLFRGHW